MFQKRCLSYPVYPYFVGNSLRFLASACRTARLGWRRGWASPLEKFSSGQLLPVFWQLHQRFPEIFLLHFFRAISFFLAHICYYFQLFLFDNNVFFLFKSTKYIMSFLLGWFWPENNIGYDGIQHHSKRRNWCFKRRLNSSLCRKTWGFSAETVPGWYFVESFKLQSWYDLLDLVLRKKSFSVGASDGGDEFRDQISSIHWIKDDPITRHFPQIPSLFAGFIQIYSL